MSADNWAICPACVQRANDAHNAAHRALAAEYGKVSIEEFDTKRQALVAPDPEDFRTFREDYEFYGAEGGEVTADYSGHCSKCGAGVDFKETRRFWDREGEL